MNKFSGWSYSFSHSTLTPERYHRLADEILDHMVEKLEEISDVTDMQGFDVEYSVSRQISDCT